MIKSDGINKRIVSQLPRFDVAVGIPCGCIKYSYAIILRVLGLLSHRRCRLPTASTAASVMLTQPDVRSIRAHTI